MTTSNFRPRYVLWLEWEGFYADETQSAPGVVTRQGRVLDVNRAAKARSIRVGMTSAEARNVVPDLTLTPWQEEAYLERQRAWLDLCLPVTHRIEPLDGHVAALDLTAHPRPEEIAETLTWSLERSVGLALHVGAGPSKWIAALAARHCGLVKAITDPAGFLAPLPVESLTRIDAAHRERLTFLGYRKGGDVARLPPEVLRAQFGEAGMHILQVARGTLADPVRPSYPPGTLSASRAFDEGPAETQEALMLGVAWISQELGEELARRSSVAKRIVLSLETEEDGELAWEHTFAKPLADERDLVGAIARMLTPMPEARIQSVRATLSELQEARRVQIDTTDRRARGDAEESLRTALLHARTAFGETAVRRGSELAIPRWARVRRAYRDATGWAWV